MGEVAVEGSDARARTNAACGPPSSSEIDSAKKRSHRSDEMRMAGCWSNPATPRAG
jgi:hypothetical protein